MRDVERSRKKEEKYRKENRSCQILERMRRKGEEDGKREIKKRKKEERISGRGSDGVWLHCL